MLYFYLTNQIKVSMILHIVTGPPGAGKTTYSASEWPDLPVFDSDLRNKKKALKRVCSADGDRVLHTSAPSAFLKEHWINKAKRAGYQPKLYCIWVPRMVAYDRMRARDGMSATQRNDLQKNVERWYSMYTRHPDEIRIDNE